MHMFWHDHDRMEVHRPIISYEAMFQHQRSARRREWFMGTLTKRHEYGAIKPLIVWQFAALFVGVGLKPNHGVIMARSAGDFRDSGTSAL